MSIQVHYDIHCVDQVDTTGILYAALVLYGDRTDTMINFYDRERNPVYRIGSLKSFIFCDYNQKEFEFTLGEDFKLENPWQLLHGAGTAIDAISNYYVAKEAIRWWLFNKGKNYLQEILDYKPRPTEYITTKHGPIIDKVIENIKNNPNPYPVWMLI